MSMKDYVDGFIRIKPKWDAEKKAYVDSALFELFIYKHNPYTGEPEVSGTRTIKVQKENHQWARGLFAGSLLAQSTY